MNATQLRKLGIPDASIKAAIQAIQRAAKGGGSSGLKKALRGVAENPQAFVGDDTFGDLARSILEEQSFAPPEPIGYRTWGSDIDQAAHSQMAQACALPVARGAALMPDAHVGYGLPIGGVLATEDAVIPYAVGVDIACRMKLSVLDTPVSALDERFRDFRDSLEKGTRFGVGSAWPKPQSHPVMDADWSVTRITREHKDKAWKQLGTSGSGNHFVEYGILTLPQRDEELGLDAGRYVALLSHSGSRGPGAAVCSTYSAIAQKNLPARYKGFGRLAWLDMKSQEGQEYWAAMNLMGEYAAANHAVIHRNVAKLLGAEIVAGVENHHNFCIPATERVPTPGGPKPVDQLRPGDEVYGFDRAGGVKLVKVVAGWRSGRKRIYTVRTAHRSIRLSADHPVLCVRRGGGAGTGRTSRPAGLARYEWVKAGDLIRGDLIVCAEGYYPTDTVPPPGLARFLGAFLGDGWVRDKVSARRRGYSFGLAIGGPAEPHTSRYLNLMQSLPLPSVPRRTWKETGLRLKNNAPGAYGISGSNKALYSLVERHGMAVPSMERRVPTAAFRYPRADKLELLAGYMDADGSVGSKAHGDGSGRVLSCGAGLAADLRELALGSGLPVTPLRSVRVRSNFGETTAYKFNIGPAGMAELDLWHEAKRAGLYRPGRYRSGRGKTRFPGLRLPPGTFAERVREVRAGEEPEDVYDIEIDHPEHAFVCEGIVVHNCWRERHGDRDLYVHRKGATPAGKGVLGVIPGSMADPAFVVRGKGSAESFDSASHGAGRRMSRTAAFSKYNFKQVQKDLAAKGVTVLSAGADEVPYVYKNILDVMAEQSDLVDVVARFDPKIVKMCGDGSKAED